MNRASDTKQREKLVREITRELVKQRRVPACRRVAEILNERRPDLSCTYMTVNRIQRRLGIEWS